MTNNEEISTPIQETSVSLEKNLFPDVSPREQTDACKVTLNSLLQSNLKKPFLDTNQQLILETFNNLIKKCSASTLSDDQFVAEKLVRTCTALLDMNVINEMETYQKSQAGEPGKSPYFREIHEAGTVAQGLRLPNRPKSCVFMTNEEKEVSIDSLRKKIFMPKTDAELRAIMGKSNSGGMVLLDNSFGFDEIQDTAESFFNLEPNSSTKCLMIPFKLNNILGGFFIYTKENDLLSFSWKFNKVYRVPFSNPPRQDIWHAYLQKGVPIQFGDTATEAQQSTDQESVYQYAETDLKEELDNFWQFVSIQNRGSKPAERALRRKLAVWRHSNTEAALSKFLDKHKEHYTRVLGREHPLYGKPLVELTRSGVTANQAVIETLCPSGWVEDDPNLPKIYEEPGFYYENMLRSLEEHYLTSKERANIFLVNVEPSFANLAMDKDGKKYAQRRDDLVAYVKSKAFSDPQKQYYLICDKTSDLLWQSFRENEILPPNLTIIETASLSKHQRGGKHYFFGSILTWGNKITKQDLDKSINIARGNLTPLGIINLPRLSESTIKNEMETLKVKTAFFVNLLNVIQDKVPEDQKWHLETYNYFTYLLPPSSLMPFIKTSPNFCYHEIKRVFEANQSIYPNVHRADSFGLDTTRITVVPTLRGYKVPRISFGIDTSYEELERFTKNFILNFSKQPSQSIIK